MLMVKPLHLQRGPRSASRAESGLSQPERYSIPELERPPSHFHNFEPGFRSERAYLSRVTVGIF